MARVKSTRRNLSREVGDSVVELGRCTVDDLIPLFRDCTRYQLQNALSAALRRGQIELVQRGCGNAPGRGGIPGIWGPKDGPGAVLAHNARAVPSVFQLAEGPVKVPAWDRPTLRHEMQGEW